MLLIKRVTQWNLFEITCYLIEHTGYIESFSNLNSVKYILRAFKDGAVDSVKDLQISRLSQLVFDTKDRQPHFFRLKLFM